MFMNLTTIEKSKAVMPLITRICADLDAKWREALALRKKAGETVDELSTIQRMDFESEIDVLIEQAKSYIDEIEELDGIVYSFEPMTIHFHILHRCQDYILCYIFGKDDSLSKCHLVNHDCDQRQPIESIGNLDAPI